MPRWHRPTTRPDPPNSRPARPCLDVPTVRSDDPLPAPLGGRLGSLARIRWCGPMAQRNGSIDDVPDGSIRPDPSISSIVDRLRAKAWLDGAPEPVRRTAASTFRRLRPTARFRSFGRKGWLDSAHHGVIDGPLQTDTSLAAERVDERHRRQEGVGLAGGRSGVPTARRNGWNRWHSTAGPTARPDGARPNATTTAQPGGASPMAPRYDAATQRAGRWAQWHSRVARPHGPTRWRARWLSPTGRPDG